VTQLLESAWVDVLDLTTAEAQALEGLGQELSAAMAVEKTEDAQPSVIECRRGVAGIWQVCVNECVGVVGTGERSWVVAPKIPMPHLAHLMQMGGTLPRTSGLPAGLSEGRDLWRLLYEWFLGRTEQVVRQDLAKGYVPQTSKMAFVRGSVDVLTVARGMLRGQTNVVCTYEDYRTDIPVNRILKSSLGLGLRSGLLNDVTARRTRRLLARFEQVSEASGDDLRVRIDRHTQKYAIAVQLGCHILRGSHREMNIGGRRAWCFLWRTPDAVEEGIRACVREALAGMATVVKTPRNHGPLTFNADLVIGADAVGDVKYSLDTKAWRRADVNQLLAFAVAYQRRRTLLVNFADATAQPKQTSVATVDITRLTWDTSRSVEGAAAQLAEDVRGWHTSVPTGPSRP
jgi:5-methylcytosine-specific restriction endonuclease McrBC regulatory subunit McrC